MWFDTGTVYNSDQKAEPERKAGSRRGRDGLRDRHLGHAEMTGIRRY
jgi:hypothetical protein